MACFIALSAAASMWATSRRSPFTAFSAVAELRPTTTAGGVRPSPRRRVLGRPCQCHAGRQPVPNPSSGWHRSPPSVLLFAGLFFREMHRQDAGTELMRRIGGHVRQGAMAYLRQQYRVMAVVFVALAALFALLAWGFAPQNPGCPDVSGRWSVLGAGRLCRYADGDPGLHPHGGGGPQLLAQSLRVAFRSGAVIGLAVVGLGLANCVGWFCWSIG